MKKMYLTLIAALILGSNVFALGETNCSNETGTVKRIENEVWGTNPVRWVVHGKSNNLEDLTVVESEKEVLGEEANLGSSRRIYKVKVELSRKDELPLGYVRSNSSRCGTPNPVFKITQTVVCDQWWDSAID